MTKSREPQLIRLLIDQLNRVGVFAWRSKNAATYDSERRTYRRFVGLRGVPDVIGVIPGGRMLAVEVKATGRLSDDQKAVLAKIDDLGGIAVVVRTEEEIDALCSWLAGGVDDEE